MKIQWFLLLVAVFGVNCKKTQVPYDRNANLDFTNMEAGGSRPLGPSKVAPAPAPAPVPAPTPAPASPTQPTAKPAPTTPPLPTAGTTPLPGSDELQLISCYGSLEKGSVIRSNSYSQAVKQG